MLTALHKLPADLTSGLDQELVARTDRFLTFGDFAVGGELLPQSLGNEVYLWLVLLRKPSLSEALAGVREARQYLRRLPWRPLAECGSETNARFLRACGFQYVADLGDRHLYRWGS